MKRDIPFDEAVKIVRAAQKLNCDTAKELFDMTAGYVADYHVEMNRRITAERALECVLKLPHTSDIKTAQHFAKQGLPKRQRARK